MGVTPKLVALAESRNEDGAKVAAVAGVSRATGYNWLAGRGGPDLQSALRLARHYGVPLEYLADDAMTEPPREPSEAEREAARLVRLYSYSLDEVTALLSERTKRGLVSFVGGSPGVTFGYRGDPAGGNG